MAALMHRWGPGADLGRKAVGMIWFFERNGEHLRCEIRLQVEGDHFDLVVTRPDGLESVEQFEDPHTLSRRTQELQRLWRSEGWDGPFGCDW